jgi:hypothetical protein
MTGDKEADEEAVMPVQLNEVFRQDAILSGRGLPGARFCIKPTVVGCTEAGRTRLLVRSLISYVDCPHFCFEAMSRRLQFAADLKQVVKRASRKHGLCLVGWRDNKVGCV